MCYFVSNVMTAADFIQIEHDFVLNWQEEERPEPIYAVSGFDHPKLPVITSENEFKAMQWGLIPYWIKDWNAAGRLRVNTLNAKSETIDIKSSFRRAVNGGRYCIVPVTGFFEWHHHSRSSKIPHYIFPNNKSVFLFAGLYEHWVNPANNEVHETFTVCTTPANERMEWIHNSKKRMPAILDVASAKLWLDKTIAPEQKRKLLNPFDVTEMLDHPISKIINLDKDERNQAKVLESVVYPELSLSQLNLLF